MSHMRSKSKLFYFFLALFALNFITASNTGIMTVQAAEGDIAGANLKIHHRSIDVDGVTRNLDGNGQFGRFKADILPEANFKYVQPIRSEADADGNIIFVARIVYEMPLNFWTTHEWRDFVNNPHGSSRTVTWFRYRTYQIGAFGGQTWQAPQNVRASWRYYERNSANYLYSNYKADIEFSTQPISLTGSNITLNTAIDNYALASMTPKADAIRRDIGTYNTNLIQSQQDIKAELYDVNSVRDLERDERDASASTALSSTLKTQMEKELIRRCGIELGHVSEPRASAVNGQNYRFVAVTAGSAIGIQNNQFTLPFELRPELRVATQEIVVNRVATMEISTADARWTHSPAVTHAGTKSSTTHNDIRALAVQNYAYSQKFEFQVEVTSKMQLDGDITADRILGDPMFEQGDLYWDMLVTGDTGAMIAYTRALGLQDVVDDSAKLSNMALEQLKMWLPYLILIVFLVAGVYVLFQFGPALGSAAKARAESRR